MEANRPDSRPTPRLLGCDTHRLVMRFQKLPIITIMGQDYRLHSTEHFDRSKAGRLDLSVKDLCSTWEILSLALPVDQGGFVAPLLER